MDRELLARLALLAIPAALTVYFAFNSGGFFPGPTGLAAVFLALVLVVRITLAERPFAGVSPAVLLAAGALALYAIWILLSASWSDSPSRALLEFDRALLYLLAVVALGTLPVTARRLEWALRGFAVAVVVVCLAGLLSRLAPDLLPTSASVSPERLSYPVSYWNALGLLAAIGAIACLHLTCAPREPRLVRALSAAAIPLLAVTLFFTFSRGAIGVAFLGLVAYLLLGRPWGALGGLLAVVPATALALVAAYGADLLADAGATGPAIAQGRGLAATLAACALGAGLLRAALSVLDDRLERRADGAAAARGARPSAAALAGTAAALAVAGIALLLVLDVPDIAERQYARFVEGNSIPVDDPRDRLASAANNGRLDHWRVAVRAFEAAPLVGQGGGTYQLLWAQRRDSSFNVVDGHSLYLETLAELGLVGLVLLGLALVTLVVALAGRARGPSRSLYGALVAAVLAWAIHAGVDWHWEMPVVTTWVFALGGLAIAARPDGGRASSPAPLTRIVAAIGCLVLAVTPALVALSQQRLDAAVAAFQRGDCRITAEAALASISFVSVRPAPFELLAYCDVRAGLPDLAVRTMRKAVARDPQNWEYHYGLALVRAAAGLDPRPQARTALRLNPLSSLARQAVRDFATDDPREWRRRAAEARLPIQV